MYGECVEFYDSVNDAVKYYFIEKIQIVLTQATTHKLIEEQKKKKKKKHRKNLSNIEKPT